VQNDKNVRLSKQKPEFSYTSGKKPELSFLTKQQYQGRGSSDDEAEFSPLGDLVEGDTDTPILFTQNNDIDDSLFDSNRVKNQNDPQISCFPDDSLDSLEAGMREFDNLFVNPVLARPATPKVDSSFANGVFDFSAFSDEGEPDIDYLKPSDQHNQETWELDEDIAKDWRVGDQEVKHRHITNAEAEQKASHQPSVPTWLSEFDADLIDGLKDFVDFID
jgi:ATP-dependent DNA helicase HFM1/MER3